MHGRPTHRLLVLPLLVAVVAACSGTASGPGGGSSPSPAPASIETPETAVDVIRAFTPLFDGLGPLNPDMIGQGSFWESAPVDAGSPPKAWKVTFTVGWGDCQAGCIDRHTWMWQVSRDGTTLFLEEAGTPLTPEMLAGLAASSTAQGVGGAVSAGPVCPVERPGDPSCAPRMVDGAALLIQGKDGTEVARFTTDGSGLFRIPLDAGDYMLAPQPVEGLMGTAAPMPFTVGQGAETWLDVPYDTGIR